MPRRLGAKNVFGVEPLIIPALKFPLFHYSSPENIIIPLFPTTAKISVILYIPLFLFTPRTIHSNFPKSPEAFHESKVSDQRKLAKAID